MTALEKPYFERAVIVGTGLLGGSLAYDLRRENMVEHIIGVTRSQKSASLSLELGVVDKILPLATAAKDADLVVLAVPMQAMPELFASLAGAVSKSALLTDVGSVKTSVYEAATTHAPDLLSQFVPAHPIAGGEKSGVRAARAGLFQDKHVIVTPTAEVNTEYVTKARGMWEAIGAQVLEMSLAEHDAVFARTSHLPHVIAFGLVHYLRSQANRNQLFDLAAAGFYDFTRIASSDAEMWRDICLTNRGEVLSALQGYADEIGELERLIQTDDADGLLAYFDAAKDARDAGLMQKAHKALKPGH